MSYLILQLSSDDSSDENEEFFKTILGGAMLAQIYVYMFLTKNPTRTSATSGMGFMLETLRTPGECHSQLRMSTEIFFDLHGLLVQKVWARTILAHVNRREPRNFLIYLCGK